MAKKPTAAEKAAAAAAATPTVNRTLLAMIAAATLVTPFYMNADAAEAAKLSALGYVEVNPDAAFATPAGPACRSTAAGVQYLADHPETAPVAAAAASPFGAPPAGTTPVAAAAAAVAPSFAIVAFTLPEAKRVGGNLGARPEVYPFSKLEVGQAFFIAATTDKPNPAKSYASTVASATERYATEDTVAPKVANRKGAMVCPKVYARKFGIRAIPDGAAFGEAYKGIAGAAVGRIA